MIIHSEYLDGGGFVYPWLIYENKYFIGVYCDVLSIPRIGTCPTGEATSVDIRIPYAENISYNFWDLINVEIGWYANGFYVHYYDTTFSTNNVHFYVYGYINDTLMHYDSSVEDDHNFTYTLTDGCNLSQTYKWQLVAELEGHDTDDDGIVDIYNGTYYAGGEGSGIVIFPRISPLIEISSLDELLEMIFGQTPFYDADNPTTNYVRWTHVLIFSFSYIWKIKCISWYVFYRYGFNRWFNFD